MGKLVLENLTNKEHVDSKDLANCETLERKLEEATVKLEKIKKEVTDAKQKLRFSLEKIEYNGKKIPTTYNEEQKAIHHSACNKRELKSKYEKTITRIKNTHKVLKLISSMKWKVYKHKIEHDLGKIEKTLKGFTTLSK